MNSQLDSARLLKTAVCRIVIRLSGVTEVAIFDIYFSDHLYGYRCYSPLSQEMLVTCSYRQFFDKLGFAVI